MNKSGGIPGAESLASLTELATKHKGYVDSAILAGGGSALAAVLLGVLSRIGGKAPDNSAKKLNESLQLEGLYSDSADSALALKRIYKTSATLSDVLVGGSGVAAAAAIPAMMLVKKIKEGRSGSTLDESKRRLRETLAHYHHLLKDETLSGSGVDAGALRDKVRSMPKEGGEKAAVINKALSTPMALLLGGTGLATGLTGFGAMYDLGSKKNEGAVSLKKMREAIERQQRSSGAPATADVGMTPEEMIAYEALRREGGPLKGRKGRPAPASSEHDKEERHTVSAHTDDPALKDLLASV